MKLLWSKSLDDQRAILAKIYDSKLFPEEPNDPLLTTMVSQPLSLARRVHDHPGLIINPTTHMAWRPYENLIDGQLDNCTPGKVRGWMRFCRSDKRPLKVHFDLAGDFH